MKLKDAFKNMVDVINTGAQDGKEYGEHQLIIMVPYSKKRIKVKDVYFATEDNDDKNIIMVIE